EQLITDHKEYIASKEAKDLPSLSKSIAPIIIPILLILAKSVMGLLEGTFGFEGLTATTFGQFIAFIGSPTIALSIATL
ncbi:GntP family permease, partial [Vibrio parahaemolyticus]|nr:GntP family permease [Vibrio parahaemolyticus]